MNTELAKWMQEVTELLCYQPDIPMQHKTDLINAYQRWKAAQLKLEDQLQDEHDQECS